MIAKIKAVIGIVEVVDGVVIDLADHLGHDPNHVNAVGQDHESGAAEGDVITAAVGVETDEIVDATGDQ